MILAVQHAVHDAIAAVIRRRFDLAEIPPFAIEIPPTRMLGDLAVPVAFQLARVLRRAPRVIAQDLASAIGTIPGIVRVVATPNGYLNLYLDRQQFLLERLLGQVPAAYLSSRQKTVVEHTAINPNKAAHIGHLRNAALGDTLVRVLRFAGTPVEVQNYIDDTGVQVADVIVGFKELEHQSLDDVKTIASTTRFDYYCWDLYSRVTAWYEDNDSRLDIRARVLHDLEQGGNETSALGAFIVDRIVRTHLRTMARLNIGYDLLTYEGDILRLQFWTHAFEILKAEGAVFLQTEGRLAGCWVMRIDEGGEPPFAADEDEGREKVIVRSNGVVTYVGKDIANQFWKFGLLGRDFRYRRFSEQSDGRALWSTTSDNGDAEHPPFGHAQRIYNVIDSRQMYLQALLVQALRTLGHPTEADNSVHFSYEMVALSHSTARELGYTMVGGDDAKPFVEVSGRKGLGVKIDDLLDLLAEKASAEVSKRNPELTDEDRRQTASQIEEALSFEGETGPYLQYAAVRANNIFSKLKDRDSVTEADILATLDSTPADELTQDPDDSDVHHLWALVLEASRLDEVVDQVERSLEFSGLAKYAFGLAQLFNGFYHRYSILNEEQVARKRWRAAGIAYFRSQFARTLDLMGIEVPVRM